MATGDIVTYPQFRLAQLNHTTNSGDRNLTTATNLKLAVLKDTWNPATSFNSIAFMDNAAVLLATHEVNTNVGYTGPIELQNITAVLNASDIPELRADDYTIPLDAAGFTDAGYWILFYDSGVVATSPAICYGDFGGTKSNVTSSLQIDFSNAADAVDTILRW